MSSNDALGRSFVRKAAATRWGMAPDSSSLAIRQRFLQRLAAADFQYDDRLIGELHALTGEKPASRAEARLLAHGEAEALQSIAAAGPSDPSRFQSRARTRRLRLESPLSQRWYTDWASLVNRLGRPASGVALQVIKSPAERRPNRDALKAIVATKCRVLQKAVGDQRAKATQVEQSSIFRKRTFNLVVFGWIAISILIGVSSRKDNGPSRGEIEAQRAAERFAKMLRPFDGLEKVAERKRARDITAPDWLPPAKQVRPDFFRRPLDRDGSPETSRLDSPPR